MTREKQIAAGTALLTAAELAPRLGYSAGKSGQEKVRAMAAAGQIPAIRIGRSPYRFHWPTVVEAFGTGQRRKK